MPSLYVENFEAGLDTRKSAFTAPPGSLRQCINAHINRGKEIEKRKAFAVFASLPEGTFGLHELKGQLYTFGSAAAPSMPPTVEYIRLTSSAGGDMIRLWATENFNGKVYAVAEFDTGEVHHFYDGTVVADWETKSSVFADAESAALALGRRIESDPTVIVDVRGQKLVLTAPAGTAFTLAAASVGGAGTVSTSTLQAAAAAVPEVLATCSFDITGGSEGTTFNTINAVTVGGVNLIGDAVDFDTDAATTATAVAARITAYAGSAHTATAAGSTVTITAPAGTGAGPNGDTLSVTPAGDVTVGSVTDMAGGVDPTPAVAQISEVQVTAHDNASLYQVTIDGTTYQILGQYAYIPLFLRTHKDKMYAGVTSLVYFSGFDSSGNPDCTQWDDTRSAGAGTGDGFLNLSTMARGAEEAVAVGVYQDRIATYTRQSTLLWNVDPDPDLNALYQTLDNVGAEAPDSVVSYGDVDVFSLDSSGIRSLRARDSSNLASADDVGVAIDDDLVPYKNSLSQDLVREVRGVIEPQDGRYLLAVGERVYVFSNFPGSRVSAWSTYELEGRVEWWAATSLRLYARIGDVVYLYGGVSGTEYDESKATATLPHLDAQNPSQQKNITGLDAGLVGRWNVDINTEPNNPDVWERVATLNESTYGSEQNATVLGKSSHVALRFTTTSASRAVLGNAMIHYDEAGV